MNSDSSTEQPIPSEKLVEFHFLTGLNGPIEPILAYEGYIRNGSLPTEADELKSFKKTLGRFSTLVENAIEIADTISSLKSMAANKHRLITNEQQGPLLPPEA